VLEPRGTRSRWIGPLFIGIAVLLTAVTLALVFTDRSLARLSDLTIRNSDTAEQDAASTVTTTTAEAVPPPTPEPALIRPDLELSAAAAFVIHGNGETVLFERAADEPLQPASTAKIVTALTVLRYAQPEEVIEIIEDDLVDPVAESSMGLQAGDHMTIHDLLVGLLLPSGNDAANALARTIGARIAEDNDEDLEPYERFVDEMNRVASDIGMDSTTLYHAAGHDRDGQTVTARDLAIAAQALLERPSLVSIVAMKSADVRVGGQRPRVITVENTNELLVHDDVYGIKTGTTTEAGQCLVVAYRDGENTTVAVILGSQDRYGDARALLGLPELPETAEDELLDHESEDSQN
jgi:serine-type D-Ala-D-Ala carboxypeptidase (penicillin-binding protein 5/6)